MKEGLGSDISHWDFNSLLGFDFDGLDSADIVGGDVSLLEEGSDLIVKVESVLRILALDLRGLVLPDGSG